VRLIVDQASAVSAVDLRTQADGIVQPQAGGTLMLDRVGKDEVVHVGDEIITSGWRSGQLASLYPRGLTIGRVTFVGKLSSDLYQQVLIRSDVDFSELDSVLVLVSSKPSPELP
jgi:rod shape-determining protein MreC